MPWLVLGVGEMLEKGDNFVESKYIEIDKYLEVLEENRMLHNENRALREKINQLSTKV